MGRVAGVTATETRERLLRAAADAFAEQGYDGTRVADIASSAGVSNGALYAHFGSKAELLVDALRAHGRRHLADMFAADPGLFGRLIAETKKRALPPSFADCRIVQAHVSKRQGAIAAIIEYLTNAAIPALETAFYYHSTPADVGR